MTSWMVRIMRTAEKISDAAMRHMSYETRLNRYHQEKNELFYRLHELTAWQIEEETARLRRKWRI